MSSERSSSSGLKTLSRNALYATLDTYLKDGSTNPKVSLNLKEKSLYAFMQAVSSDYHSSHTSLGLENGANNGGRGLKARHYETKLGQRALTLIKGGIGTRIVKSTSDMVDNSNAGKWKKGRRNNDIIRLPGSKSRKKRKRCQNEVDAHHTASKFDGAILFGLHKMWQKYIKTLLQNCVISNQFDVKEASSLIATAEFVGAFVKIKSSNSCKSHVGKQGYVVEITKNTWRMAVPVDGSIDVADARKVTAFKIIIVPKKESSLVMRIRRNEDDNDSLYIEISGNI